MKKTLKFAFCFLFITFTLQGVAQKSVTESTKAAQKLMKKVTKGQFNKLQTNYETALIEINDCEKKSKEKEFGNDALVERLPDWITLNKTLSQFPNAYVVFKADTIHFAIKDYTQTLVEAKASAAKAHFDAATKIINTETEYSKRASAFRHFKKVAIYSDKYNDQIKELSAKIHYEEGLKIYNSGTTFDEKLQAEFAFKKAKEFIQPYKNIDELMAKLYFDEAVKLSKSASTDDLSNASRFFTNTNNYVADYKGCLKLKSDTRNKAAEIVYQKALAEEKKMSFESQAEAAKLYNAVETWVKGYKNAGEKANQALARCEVNVFLIENDGSFIHPRSFENGLQNKTKKYILTPPAPESISNLDLNVTKNITVAKEKLGYGFVLIKVGNSAKDPKFTQTDGPVKTTIKNYYSIDVNNGGAEKKINEKTYTDGVTLSEIFREKSSRLLS